MKFRLAYPIVSAAAALMMTATGAMAQTELRMTWYNDGIEGEVMRDLLDRFEAENSDIKVVLDVVPYKAIIESLPIQLAAGEGPDIARVTDLGGLAVSSGSACSSAKPEPSHVLLALGHSKALARGSLRFGLGRGNTLGEIDEAVQRVSDALTNQLG